MEALTGHLYFDGRHYDQRLIRYRQDLPFWFEMAEQCGDPILELGCGTGRVAIPLAKRGHIVTGVDLSHSMLAQALRKSKAEDASVAWVMSDMRDFALKRKFPLVIATINTLCHLLTLEELEACLASVKRHLTPGGRFVIDVFNPSLDILLRDPEERYAHSEYQDLRGQGTIMVTQTNMYDAATQINRITLFYRFPDRKDEITEELKMRIYFPKELDELLIYNGFTIEEKFGDYEKTPFRPGSPKQLLVCKNRDTSHFSSALEAGYSGSLLH